MDIERRTLLKTAGLGALALGLGWARGGAALARSEEEEGPSAYELTRLPYACDALAPDISEEVVRLHHTRHHAGYVRGLNATLGKLAAARKARDFSAVKALSRDLAFHGSGHVLHDLYWRSMRGGEPTAPPAALSRALARDFGSVEAFLGQFKAASAKTEASGWGVLAWEPLGRRLVVLQAEKHQNLTFWGCAPLLVCDVWEHAYYAQYRNDRGAYVEAFCRRIDWAGLASRLDAVRGG